MIVHVGDRVRAMGTEGRVRGMYGAVAVVTDDNDVDHVFWFHELDEVL